MNIAGKLIAVCEQRGCSAGVNEDDVLLGRDSILANVIDQAGHALAAVRWIEQDAFRSSQPLNRFEAPGSRNAVPLADVLLRDLYV